MVKIDCNSNEYIYKFIIENMFVTTAENIETAKKQVLAMIEEEMDAEINKKLDSSFVRKVDRFELDMEGNMIDIG